jgi:serine/threonine protein kinase
VHRDLKPANICFDAKDRPVVVDFGFARLLEGTDSSLHSDGTPHYMAPEQWLPTRGVGPWTDIYALGAILFELLTGRPPFRAETLPDLMRAHLTEPPPVLSVLRSDVPAHVSDAVLVALAKEPDQRFASVRDFADAVSGRLVVTPNDTRGPHTAMDLRRSGDTLARGGSFEEAIQRYTMALRVDEMDVLSLINRGYCHYRVKRYINAIADYDRALRLDPSHPEALNNRGMACMELGLINDAIADFRSSVASDPSHPLANNNLQAALQRKNRDAPGLPEARGGGA